MVLTYRKKESITAKAINESVVPDDYKIEEITGYASFDAAYKAQAIYSRKSDDPLLVQLNNEVFEYNNIVRTINNEPGFIEYFKANNFSVSREQIEEKFSKEFASVVFSLHNYLFVQQLNSDGTWLYDTKFSPKYSFEIDGMKFSFKKSDNGIDYSYPLNTGHFFFWNQIEDERDATFYLCEFFEKHNMLPDIYGDEEYYYDWFSCYEQAREAIEKPDFRLLKAMKLLKDCDYLKSYNITPEDYHPSWSVDFLPDKSVDFYTLDESFLKDSLMMNRLKLLLCSDLYNADSCYFLTDKNNKQYISSMPGLLGGHKKLKIYGQLDCKSAQRYIENGQYVKNRIFFENEETAIAAGYRPCGVCMKSEYEKWKSEQE